MNILKNLVSLYIPHTGILFSDLNKSCDLWRKELGGVMVSELVIEKDKF